MSENDEIFSVCFTELIYSRFNSHLSEKRIFRVFPFENQVSRFSRLRKIITPNYNAMEYALLKAHVLTE